MTSSLSFSVSSCGLAKFVLWHHMQGTPCNRSRVGLHAYAVLHIWAYKTYQPAMPAKQRQWLIEYAHKIKLSIDKAESDYRRDTSFDEAIEVLLPELGEHLSSPFGTDLMGDEGSGKDRSKA